MWPSQLSPFLLALAVITTTCAGSPLFTAIIPTAASLAITPTLNLSTPLIPIPTWVTRRTPIPLHTSPTKKKSSFSPSSSSTSSSSHSSSNHTSASTPVIPAPLVVEERGDIRSAVTTATLYSAGRAYTVTQFGEVNPELSTVGLTTTYEDGTLVTAPATMPVVASASASATSGAGSPWRTTGTTTTTSAWSEDPALGSSSGVSVSLPIITSAF